MAREAAAQQLQALATLLARRNQVDAEIAKLIGRPAERGHIGEYIAAEVFDIELHDSAVHAGSDGTFRSGPLVRRQVNVKYYGKQEGLLDLKKENAPEFYLVLTGARRAAVTSRGTTRPLVIQSVFLFEHKEVTELLLTAGRRIGLASSVRRERWAAAKVWPAPASCSLMNITEDQATLLGLFQEVASGMRGAERVLE